MQKFNATRCLVAFYLALATACSLIATYDQVAYEKATSTKAETLALMGKATGPYASHQKEIGSRQSCRRYVCERRRTNPG
jgi:hypothetical protein